MIETIWSISIILINGVSVYFIWQAVTLKLKKDDDDQRNESLSEESEDRGSLYNAWKECHDV